MGRYYSGDIEGKFWFGIQSSNDADFFGVEGMRPDRLNYYFEKEDLNKVEKGIKICLEKLGEFKEKLDNFFKEKDSYNDKQIVDELLIKEEEVQNLLEWYARLHLGEQIKKCLEEHGECSFEAEL